MATTWNRLRHMPAREIAERGVMAARQAADRWWWRARRPRWNRSRLATALAQWSSADALALLARGDFGGAHRALSDYYAARPQLFVITASARDTVARLVRSRFPHAIADAQRRADHAIDGRLDLLGYRGVSFTHGPRQPMDWSWDPVHDRRAPDVHWSEVAYLDPAIGDHKVIWELNRHQHWLFLGRAYWLTGDQRYRAAFIEQLQGWMAANPPRTGINWASMLELSLRVISWIWSLHLFVETRAIDETGCESNEPAWLVDLLLGIHAQLSLVERHLSTYFSPNTHLLGEALALYVAGRALPEFRASPRWTATGRHILLEQAARQINGDGGHAELSTHYHRYALDFYSLALAVARMTGDSNAISPLSDAVDRLAGYARDLSDHYFHLPQIGDDDGGMLFPICGSDARDAGPALAIAAALLDCPELGDGRPHEEVVWMVGAVPAVWHRRATRQSTVLRDSGYVVSRTSRGDHLVFDVGPLGYLNAGHAHADALSVTLSVAGQPLLIDPGTGGYTIDRTLRDRFRSTAAHNTIVLDGRWQSAPSGPFHWHSRAAVRLETCQLERDCDFIEATHDGYDAFIHRRQVLSRPGCWIVVDWLSGDRESPIAAHWHLDPAWRIGSMEPGRTALVHASGTTVWMLTSVPDVETRVSGDDGLGWWAPVYGAIEPTTTLRVPVTASTPHALITVFVEDLAARLQLPADWSPQGPTPEPIAFRVVATGWEDTVVAAGPTVATVEGAKYGLSGRGRLLCARASVPLGAAVLAAAR